MSWKSFVTAGLLCALASPVFAAPSLQVVKAPTGPASGHLNASGDWVWLVQIAPTSPLVDATGTPLATELGFRETSSASIVGSATIADTALWDTPNPGGSEAMQQKIFTWEAVVDVDNGPGENLRPAGITTNNATDEVASYFGSDIITATGQTNYMNIVVSGPRSSSLSTSIQWLGAYGGMGRIAELDEPGAAGACPENACNYDTYAGTATRTAFLGDVNLSGMVDDTDLATLLINFNQSGRAWHEGNFNRQTDSVVNDTDLATLLINFGMGAPVGPGGGGGAVAASAAPEPATLALLGLAAVCGLGLRRRR